MLTDLRLALRRLLAAPLVALVAVLSLALGIGATVAAFSFLEVTALRPFPLVPRPERVVRVRTAARGQRPGVTSYPAFAAYRDGVPALAALAFAYSERQELMQSQELADHWNAALAFLQARARIGRRLRVLRLFGRRPTEKAPRFIEQSATARAAASVDEVIIHDDKH